eukprot:CCRYP_019267-RA/>CCRYP_019267-RA protein AED:0.00 eAED:0.00 QI:49/1/1/1/0/0/2/178/147
MISIKAIFEIHSGSASSPLTSEHTINLTAKCTSSLAVLTPHCIQTALATSKMKTLRQNKKWICIVCCSDATSSCSVIVAYPEKSTLRVHEKIYLTCLKSECIDAARHKRNKDSIPGAYRTNGVRLAFRCAHEQMVNARDQLECEREE